MALVSSKRDWRCREICPSVVYSAPGDVPPLFVVNHTLTKVQLQGEKVYVQRSGFTGTMRIVYYQPGYTKKYTPLYVFTKILKTWSTDVRWEQSYFHKMLWRRFQLFGQDERQLKRALNTRHVVPDKYTYLESCLFKKMHLITLLARWDSLAIILQYYLQTRFMKNYSLAVVQQILY